MTHVTPTITLEFLTPRHARPAAGGPGVQKISVASSTSLGGARSILCGSVSPAAVLSGKRFLILLSQP